LSKEVVVEVVWEKTLFGEAATALWQRPQGATAVALRYRKPAASSPSRKALRVNRRTP
jgi:hypothetical protein